MKRDQAASRHETNDLVRSLAREAGRAGGEWTGGEWVRAGRLPFAVAFPAAALAAIAASLAVVLALAGPRADFLVIAGSWIFLFKATAMLLLAGGSLVLVRAAAIPGRAVKPVFALAPALLFLAVNALADRSGVSLLGARPPLSALICVGTIILASLPALALILAAMRRGIPTRLRQAGFFAGMLAGAAGALGYTVACVNDGAAFVALWYLAAVLIVAGIGAAAGPKSLAW